MNEDYRLKPEDFIPIIGAVNHHKRGIKGMEELIWSESSKYKETEMYAANSSVRDFMLVIYNTILAGAAYAAASGLVELLSRKN